MIPKKCSTGLLKWSPFDLKVTRDLEGEGHDGRGEGGEVGLERAAGDLNHQ